MADSNPPEVGDLRFRPLTPQTFDDLETLFAMRGCAVARGCWCVDYRFSGDPPVDPVLARQEARRELLRYQVRDGRFVGLLAYHQDNPVGWCSFGPREDFPVLRRSPVMKPVDDTPVWSIVCFVVPSAHRHRGIAVALLGAAQQEAAGRAVTLESYPVEDANGNADPLWFGTAPMFLRAGFTEVARRRPRRPVMRWTP